MKIREQAIKDTREARAQAPEEMTPEEIDQKYPYPEIIYICGTVEPETATETWELSDVIIDGITIRTEVVSHIDVTSNGTTEGLYHVTPTTLINVGAGKNLTLKDVKIRNITNEIDSDTIVVTDGGKLVFTGKTTLTGERMGDSTHEATYGRHVNISSTPESPGSIFIMDSEWDEKEGSIEKRQQGVVATGKGTQVFMYNGSIRENVSFNLELFNSGKNTQQLSGAGVVLTYGASFTMDGGTITKNIVYNKGAGVYLLGSSDNYAAFDMKKGTISENEIAKPTYNSYAFLAHGVGIYANYATLYIGEQNAVIMKLPHLLKTTKAIGLKGQGFMQIYAI